MDGISDINSGVGGGTRRYNDVVEEAREGTGVAGEVHPVRNVEPRSSSIHRIRWVVRTRGPDRRVGRAGFFLDDLYNDVNIGDCFLHAIHQSDEPGGYPREDGSRSNPEDGAAGSVNDVAEVSDAGGDGDEAVFTDGA